MKILVLYDSFFGNTEQIAQTVTKALQPDNSLVIKRVSEVESMQMQGLDLLVIGSPTRGFRPSKATSAFLKGLPASALSGVKAAAFDTRIDAETIKPGILRGIVKMGGYAVKPMTDMLRKKGAEVLGVAQGFFVEESEGPLRDGELERAAEWAKNMLAGS